MNRNRSKDKVRTNSLSFERNQPVAKAVAKPPLTPLSRLARFKKNLDKPPLPVRRSKRDSIIVKTKKIKPIMEQEGTVNGTHEIVVEETQEKILKLKQSAIQAVGETFENGGSEHENGFQDVSEKGEETAAHLNGHDKKAMTAPDTPSKKKQRTRESSSREATPKPEALSKRSQRRGTPRRAASIGKDITKVIEETHEEVEEIVDERKDEVKLDDVANIETEIIEVEESVVVVDESVEIKEEDIEGNKSETGGFFSIFRRSPSTSPVAEQKVSEPSTSSVICLDDSSVVIERDIVPNKISGRRAINCFSRFSASPNSSLKRKAADCFEDDLPKRYVGECNSGSEKSPGWSFFSRMWSPSPKKAKASLSSSTPFKWSKPEDSMAVNYNEESKMELEETTPMLKEQSATPTPSVASTAPQPQRWCSLM